MLDETRRGAVVTRPLSAVHDVMLSSVECAQRGVLFGALARVCVARRVINAPGQVLLPMGVAAVQASKVHATSRLDGPVAAVARASTVHSDDERVDMGDMPAAVRAGMRWDKWAPNVCEAVKTVNFNVLPGAQYFVDLQEGDGSVARCGAVVLFDVVLGALKDVGDGGSFRPHVPIHLGIKGCGI